VVCGTWYVVHDTCQVVVACAMWYVVRDTCQVVVVCGMCLVAAARTVYNLKRTTYHVACGTVTTYVVYMVHATTQAVKAETGQPAVVLSVK